MPKRQVTEQRHRLPADPYRGDVTVSATICVEDRRPLFTDTDVVETFVGKLRVLSERWNCWVPIYCFMPDHLHVIVKGEPDVGDAKAFLDGFKTSTGIWLSRQRPGRDLQKDYHDHIMRVGEDWRNHAFYVLNNPVRAGLIKDPYAWPYTGSIGYPLGEMFSDLTENPERRRRLRLLHGP